MYFLGLVWPCLKYKIMNQRNIVILLLIIILLGLIVLYSTVSPSSSILFPKCPFLMLTGLECPGCGSQRTVHALLNLDIRKAWTTNPLVVLIIPYLFVTLLAMVTRVKSKNMNRCYELLTHKYVIFLYLIIYISYFIYRNL